MLFVANSLPFNGGTTFLLRLCKELSSQGESVGVIVLFDIIDKDLEVEIKKYAHVYYLKDFLLPLFKWAFGSQVGTFFPLRFKSIKKIIEIHGGDVHVMGVFGLLFMCRFLNNCAINLRLSVGVYHQNEFMFDKADYYFTRMSKEIFSYLSPQSIVFFNEKSRDSLSNYFSRDYALSTLVPIGVDVPSDNQVSIGSGYSNRIVSIGNLYNFKTYNRHVINCLPELLDLNPNLKYEIYGEGPFEVDLRDLVNKLGLESSVSFNGRIAYEQMVSVLEGALVFVGSGTAIIEASAQGVPSIIGIESSVEPITYGFLSDISGFSYNEMSDSQELFLIKDKISEILMDSNKWIATSDSCSKKACDFSIAHTAKGFMGLKTYSVNPDLNSIKYNNLLSCISFLLCAVKYKAGLDNSFMDRRNQGTIA